MVSGDVAGRRKVRVLTLEARQDGKSVLYRLDQDTTLQFRLGPTLLGCKIELSVNHPSEGDPGSFERARYRSLAWSYDGNDDTAAFVDLPLVRSGSFEYKFTSE